jgi:hypothetical protein
VSIPALIVLVHAPIETTLCDEKSAKRAILSYDGIALAATQMAIDRLYLFIFCNALTAMRNVVGTDLN